MSFVIYRSMSNIPRNFIVHLIKFNEMLHLWITPNYSQLIAQGTGESRSSESQNPIFSTWSIPIDSIPDWFDFDFRFWYNFAINFALVGYGCSPVIGHIFRPSKPRDNGPNGNAASLKPRAAPAPNVQGEPLGTRHNPLPLRTTAAGFYCGESSVAVFLRLNLYSLHFFKGQALWFPRWNGNDDRETQHTSGQASACPPLPTREQCCRSENHIFEIKLKILIWMIQIMPLKQ